MRCSFRLLFPISALSAVFFPVNAHAAPLTVRAPRSQQEREAVERRPSFATSIDLRERGRTADSVAPLLDEAPSVHPRSSGDGLSPTVLSVRGAPATHVLVSLDGAILNDGLGVSVDLSLIPPSLLERADIYRGIAPARLGLGGPGGAAEFHLRTPTQGFQASATLSGGSFFQRRLSTAFSIGVSNFSLLAALSYRGTNGDFGFYNDNGTPTDARDDLPDTTRLNNEANAGEALVRSCVQLSIGPLCTLVLGGLRLRGLPGPGSRQLLEPRLTQGRFLLRSSLRARLPGSNFIEPFLQAMIRYDHFLDGRGLSGSGAPINAPTTGSILEPGFRSRFFTNSFSIDAGARLRWEYFDSVSADTTTTQFHRVAINTHLEATLPLNDLSFQPGLIAEVQHDQALAATARPSPPRLLFSPRIAARVPLASWLDLRAHLVHTERAPSLIELFGIGEYVRGNNELRPESSNGVDLGAVFSGVIGPVNLRAELVGYARTTRDLIVLARSGPYALKAFNLQRADTFGAESSLRIRWASYGTITFAYAFTEAVQRTPGTVADGRRVPNAPAHDLSARLDGRYGPLLFSADVSFVGGIFFDTFNVLPAPSRTLVGASVTWVMPFYRALRIGISGTNLLDQRSGNVTVRVGRDTTFPQPIADFEGYPLPGRSLMLNVLWDLASR